MANMLLPIHYHKQASARNMDRAGLTCTNRSTQVAISSLAEVGASLPAAVPPSSSFFSSHSASESDWRELVSGKSVQYKSPARKAFARQHPKLNATGLSAVARCGMEKSPEKHVRLRHAPSCKVRASEEFRTGCAFQKRLRWTTAVFSSELCRVSDRNL